MPKMKPISKIGKAFGKYFQGALPKMKQNSKIGKTPGGTNLVAKLPPGV